MQLNAGEEAFCICDRSVITLAVNWNIQALPSLKSDMKKHFFFFVARSGESGGQRGQHEEQERERP